MSNIPQSVTFSNLGTGATNQFYLKGGRYIFTWQATVGGGNIQFQILAADGSTWLNYGSTLTAVGVSPIFECPPGQYRFNITTSTANYIAIANVPY